MDPGSDPSSDPGSDPSSSPGLDPSSNPGSDPGFILSLSLIKVSWRVFVERRNLLVNLLGRSISVN